MITKNVIQVIVDAEMQDIKRMKKKDLVGLVRELLEDKVLEMSDYAIQDYYEEITGV